MGMTIEDIIQGLKETYMICCSVYAYDRKKYIDGAIDRLHKYQMMQADYDTRLKADMVAMLTEIQLEIEDLYPEHQCTGELTGFADAIETITPIIQQKINALKAEIDP